MGQFVRLLQILEELQAAIKLGRIMFRENQKTMDF